MAPAGSEMPRASGDVSTTRQSLDRPVVIHSDGPNGNEGARTTGSASQASIARRALVRVDDGPIESDEFHVHEGPAFTNSAQSVRELVASRSREIFEFIAPLETEIRRVARVRRSSPRLKRTLCNRVAELVFSTIRELSQRETGMFGLEPRVDQLANLLFAGPAECAVIDGMLSRARGVLQVARGNALLSADQADGSAGEDLPRSVRAILERYDLIRELEELTMLLKWYARRKSSLVLIEASNQRIGFEEEEGAVDDALFGFDVLHDQPVFGVKGCSVGCGLRLVGHDGEALWLRVSAFVDGVAVGVRPGWDSWVDVAEEGSVGEAGMPFCSLVPIRPNAQRLILDDVRVFVPYRALRLPPGRTQVELLCAVVNQDGDVLLSASRFEDLAIPPTGDEQQRALAPHAIGIWPQDVVSGDKISSLKVQSGYTVIGGWEQSALRVSCELSLFMHAGDALLIECRFTDQRGELIEVARSAAGAFGDGRDRSAEGHSYRVRRILRPRTALTVIPNLAFEVPIEFLHLNPGGHELLCEVVVLSADDRVLCGDIAAVTVSVPSPTVNVPSPLRDSRGGELLPANQDSTPRFGISAPKVRIDEIEVQPQASFGESESVRVEVRFACDDDEAGDESARYDLSDAANPYRVILSLEHAGGMVLQSFTDELGLTYRPTSRSVCLEGHVGQRNQSVACNFAHDEIVWGGSARGDQRSLPMKHALIVRVRAVTLDGEVFLEETKEFFVKPEVRNREERALQSGDLRPTIVDVHAVTFLQSSKFSARVYVNVPCQVVTRESVTFAAHLVGVEGSGVKPTAIKPFRQKLSPRHLLVWGRAGLDLVHFPIQVEGDIGTLDAGDRAPVLRCELISEFGEVLQRADQVVTVQRAPAAAAHGQSSREPSRPVSAVRESEPQSSPSDRRGKGLLSWLQRS
jgi:hypothetical protein